MELFVFPLEAFHVLFPHCSDFLTRVCVFIFVPFYLIEKVFCTYNFIVKIWSQLLWVCRLEESLDKVQFDTLTLFIRIVCYSLVHSLLNGCDLVSQGAGHHLFVNANVHVLGVFPIIVREYSFHILIDIVRLGDAENVPFGATFS